MTLKELYTEAIKLELKWLCVLIEFLILEKKVHSWDDKEEVLDLYFKPKHQERMNKLLIEYEEET